MHHRLREPGHLIAAGLLILLLFHIGGAVTASAQVYLASNPNQRHYPGQRYVALKTVRVFAKPDQSSPIVYDIPRGRMLYAKKTERDGWLEITGAGTRHHPSRAPIREIGFENGRFKISDENSYDQDRYFPHTGYIKAALVQDIETSAPPLANGLVPVGSPFEALGIPDERRFALNQSTGPIAAVGQLLYRKKSGTLSHLCTGFLLGDTTTFVTNAHCLTRPDVVSYHVRFPAENARDDLMNVKLYASGSKDVTDKYPSEDWAIFELPHPPHHNPRPLQLAKLSSFKDKAKVHAAAVGFPADLEAVSVSQYGYYAPAVSSCTIDTGTVDLFLSDGKSHYSAIICFGWGGNSGGPVLVWSEADLEWQVIAIQTTALQSKGRSIVGTYAVWEHFQAAHGLSALNKLFGDELLRLKLPTVQFSPKSETMRDTVPWMASVYQFGNHNEGKGGGWWMATLEQSLARRGVIRSTTDWAQIGAHPGMIGTVYDNHEVIELDDAVGVPEAGLNRKQPPALLEIPATEMAEARGYCLDHCSRDLLDERYQSTLSYGDRFPSGLEREPHSFLGHLDDGQTVVIRGGDFFVFDPTDRMIRRVVRSFMGIQTRDAPLQPTPFLHTDCLPGVPDQQLSSRKPTDPAVQPTQTLRSGDFGAATPLSVPGATTIGVLGVCRMLQDPTSPPLVISALDNRLGIPTAVSLPEVARGGSFDDTIQATLKADILRRLGDQPDRSIVTYCHHADCWLSYNTTLRLVRAGFKNVYWMRDGIAGWIGLGFPLQAVDIAVSSSTANEK